jgi:hypothetical protein
MSSAPPKPAEPERPVDERRAVDRKLSRARARLFTRLDELGRRVEKAKDAVDVAKIVREHPFLTVGVAFSAGMLLALPKGKGRIGREITAMIMGMAAHAGRTALQSWLLDHVRGPAGAGADR